MKHLLFGLFITLFSFAGISSFAQDSTLTGLPGEWSLEECIAYAKKNNIQLNTLRLSTASAEQDLIQARANQLPNLSGSISQTLVNSKNTDPVVGGFQTQSSFSSGYGISSSTILFNGGYLKNDIRSKQLSVESANLSVQESANEVTLSITQAFLNILLARENITTLTEIVNTTQAQLKQGQQRYDAGSIARKDLLQLESQLASDNYNLVNANNAYRSNLASLKQILQLPTNYNLSIEIPDKVEPTQAVQPLSEAQQLAIDSRPEVRNSELGVKISEVELAKIKAGRLPTISVGAGLSSGYSYNTTTKYISQLNNNFYQSVGVTVSIPIFSRKQNKTNIARSQILIEQNKLALLNTKTVLNQQVEQAYINLQNAVAQYSAAEKQLDAARQSYQITNEELKLGSLNTLELLQQKTTYVQATQAYVQAKYGAILYNKIYDFYAGMPVTF